MNSETIGALSLATRYLNKNKINKVQKHLNRAHKYSGMSFRIKRILRCWYIIIG